MSFSLSPRNREWHHENSVGERGPGRTHQLPTARMAPDGPLCDTRMCRWQLKFRAAFLAYVALGARRSVREAARQFHVKAISAGEIRGQENTTVSTWLAWSSKHLIYRKFKNSFPGALRPESGMVGRGTVTGAAIPALWCLRGRYAQGCGRSHPAEVSSWRVPAPSATWDQGEPMARDATSASAGHRWAVSDRSNALRDMSVSRTPARAASRSSRDDGIAPHRHQRLPVEPGSVAPSCAILAEAALRHQDVQVAVEVQVASKRVRDDHDHQPDAIFR